MRIRPPGEGRTSLGGNLGGPRFKEKEMEALG